MEHAHDINIPDDRRINALEEKVKALEGLVKETPRFVAACINPGGNDQNGQVLRNFYNRVKEYETGDLIDEAPGEIY